MQQATHDIGVCMAVGASPRAVLRQALTGAMGGIVVGAVLTAAATRLMQGMLYGVGATDPVTFGAVAVVLGTVAPAASLLPAWRATKVDPMVVLRYEEEAGGWRLEVRSCGFERAPAARGPLDPR